MQLSQKLLNDFSTLLNQTPDTTADSYVISCTIISAMEYRDGDGNLMFTRYGASPISEQIVREPYYIESALPHSIGETALVEVNNGEARFIETKSESGKFLTIGITGEILAFDYDD